MIVGIRASKDTGNKLLHREIPYRLMEVTGRSRSTVFQQMKEASCTESGNAVMIDSLFVND